MNSEFFKTIGNNPCLFFEENGYKQLGFEQFNELQNAGYPKTIALAEGVAFFNRLAQCNQVGKTQPALRPEEVIGAIASWDCAKEAEAFQTKPYDENTCRQFKEIIKTGNLPKGAWLDQSGGTCPNCNGYTVAIWEIRLYLNQDKYRRDYKGNPIISRLLRLNYPSAERNQ